MRMDQPAANQSSIPAVEFPETDSFGNFGDVSGAETSIGRVEAALSVEHQRGTPENPTSSGSESNQSIVVSICESLKTVLCSRDDRRFLLFACGLSLLVITLRYSWLASHRPPPLIWDHDTQLRAFQVNVNDADWPEWVQLDGIGRETAVRIIEDREANGPFLSIDDVGRVEGIGATTLDRIRGRLTIDNDESKEWPQEVGADVGSRSEKVIEQFNARK